MSEAHVQHGAQSIGGGPLQVINDVPSHTQVQERGHVKDSPGGTDDVAVLLRQAVDGDLSLAGLVDGAMLLQAQGRFVAVSELYSTWLAHNGNHPLAYAARFNYAVTLANDDALAEARDMLLAALGQKPDFAAACINLGSVLERLGDRPGAVAAWQRVTAQLSAIDATNVGYKTSALNQLARVLEAARIDEPAEAAMRASLDLDPVQPEVIQHLIALRQARCAWPVLQDAGRVSRARLFAAISPLSLAVQLDDPVLQLANAHRYHCRDAQWPGIATVGQWPPPAPGPARPLRVGYVSSDLRQHAVGYLMTRLFALHDRQRVQSTLYYCGAAREDGLKAHFRRTADRWRDIAPLTDRQAAALIVQDEIDILVDVNGYTRDGRIKLFAARPAPVIVNWLGFPGSLGSPHHHYIIADRHIVPPGDERFYAEQVLRLPCYQPNDSTRTVSPTALSRAAAGLPERAFVFCVFNGTHKITPTVFAVWMRVLAATPGSVLWLLCGEAETQARLSDGARQAGVDPARLVFAGRMENDAHLGRYALADLFLDTAPYGAHTTASDALWMGVPVVTREGNSFAARVCASLVRAAGIGELACDSWESYEAAAIGLAQSPALLEGVRARLRTARDTCPLFDTPLLVRSLEALYAQAWQAYCDGVLPVPRLAHLPLYHRLGCDPDRDGTPGRDALIGHYHAALRYSDAMEALPSDPLLWPDGGMSANLSCAA